MGVPGLKGTGTGPDLRYNLPSEPGSSLTGSLPLPSSILDKGSPSTHWCESQKLTQVWKLKLRIPKWWDAFCFGIEETRHDRVSGGHLSVASWVVWSVPYS